MTTRMLHLLGELKRQMNGAVAASMRFYGADYGLNYGVNIPTIRSLARAETQEHKFAKYLYQQDVRELRLLSLWIADPSSIDTPEELNFWARGIINSEVAEEAAFVLLCAVDSTRLWLEGDDELLQYCAVMSLAGRAHLPLEDVAPQLQQLLTHNPSLLAKGVVALLDRQLREGAKDEVVAFVDALPQNSSCSYIREEMSWRVG